MYYAETLHPSVKSVQMWSFFWSVSFCIQTEYGDLFSPNTGKYEPKKALYLDTFYAVYIQKNKGFRDPVPRAKQVGAAIYYLAHEGRMRKVANSFGIRKSTILKIIGRNLFLV